MSRAFLMSGVQYDSEIKQGKVRITELAPVAKELGLAGVEYREVYWRDKESELPAVREQLATLNLRGTYATFSTLFNRALPGRERLIGDLIDADELGSSLLRIFPGEWPSGAEEAEMWDGAGVAIARAEELGITVAVENFARAPGNHLREIERVMSHFTGPLVGTNVDVANYAVNDEDPIAAIRSLGPRIRYVHLKDVKLTPEGKAATVVGTGILPYRDILAALDASGQDFPLCFEFGGEGHPETSLREARDFLSSL